MILKSEMSGNDSSVSRLTAEARQGGAACLNCRSTTRTGEQAWSLKGSNLLTKYLLGCRLLWLGFFN